MISGKIGNKKVQVLQDSRCNKVIVKRELCDDANFFGKVGNLTVDQMLTKAPNCQDQSRYAIFYQNCQGYVHKKSSV